MEQKLGRKLSNDEIAYALHQSRAKKLKGISTAEVRERQLAQLQPDELQMLRQLSAFAHPKPTTPDTDRESKALAHAVAHIFERNSVVPEHELLGVALSQRPGEVDLPRLKAAVNQSPAWVNTERGFSTKEIVATELDLIQTVNASCDAVGPLNYSHIRTHQRAQVDNAWMRAGKATGCQLARWRSGGMTNAVIVNKFE